VAVTPPLRVQVEPRTAGVCHPLRAGSPTVRLDARKTIKAPERSRHSGAASRQRSGSDHREDQVVLGQVFIA
jgi:hypothetical protein